MPLSVRFWVYKFTWIVTVSVKMKGREEARQGQGLPCWVGRYCTKWHFFCPVGATDGCARPTHKGTTDPLFSTGPLNSQRSFTWPRGGGWIYLVIEVKDIFNILFYPTYFNGVYHRALHLYCIPFVFIPSLGVFVRRGVNV